MKKITNLKVADNNGIKKASFKIQQEVALVALTYRTSYKSLAIILGTTIEDIEDTFRHLDNLSVSLHYLNQETLNEDEMTEEIAFNKTKDYFLKKTKLHKKIKEDAIDKEEAINEFNLLHREIYDQDIRPLLEKTYRELSDEEKEKMARYRLKYYLSVRAIKRNSKLGPISINRIEEELAMKDPIYSDKLDLLHYVYDQQRESYRPSKK